MITFHFDPDVILNPLTVGLAIAIFVISLQVFEKRKTMRYIMLSIAFFFLVESDWLICRSDVLLWQPDNDPVHRIASFPPLRFLYVGWLRFGSRQELGLTEMNPNNILLLAFYVWSKSRCAFATTAKTFGNIIQRYKIQRPKTMQVWQDGN